MRVEKIFPRGFASNSYLVTADGASAVAIDPAQPRVGEEAARRGLKVAFVLLTHGHFDHIGGCAALQAAGAKIGCLAGEEDLARFHHLGRELGGVSIPPFGIDFTFSDGETLDLCGISFRVLATPGHTAGSCCFLAGDALFTGDTLFCGDVGRTDLPTGNAARLAGSLRLLSSLGKDYHIYPGHGEDTSLFYEKTHNGWLESC